MTNSSSLFACLRFILPVLGFVALLPHRLVAQPREPAFEVFALSGGYFHGNVSIASKWRPQFGAGVLAPLGRRWGAFFDATTSVVETYWKPDGLPGAGPNDNFTRERRVAVIPSLVGLWRRDRFSIYGGGGVGFEHERQRSRVRPIIARDERGQPVLADEFQNLSPPSPTAAMPALRAGASVSLSRRIVFRADFSFLKRYVDAEASKILTAGIGYRF